MFWMCACASLTIRARADTRVVASGAYFRPSERRNSDVVSVDRVVERRREE